MKLTILFLISEKRRNEGRSLPPAAGGSQEAGFTQPRTHSFAQPCTFVQFIMTRFSRQLFKVYRLTLDLLIPLALPRNAALGWT